MARGRKRVADGQRRWWDGSATGGGGEVEGQNGDDTSKGRPRDSSNDIAQPKSRQRLVGQGEGGRWKAAAGLPGFGIRPGGGETSSNPRGRAGGTTPHLKHTHIGAVRATDCGLDPPPPTWRWGQVNPPPRLELTSTREIFGFVDSQGRIPGHFFGKILIILSK